MDAPRARGCRSRARRRGRASKVERSRDAPPVAVRWCANPVPDAPLSLDPFPVRAGAGRDACSRRAIAIAGGGGARRATSAEEARTAELAAADMWLERDRSDASARAELCDRAPEGHRGRPSVRSGLPGFANRGPHSRLGHTRGGYTRQFGHFLARVRRLARRRRDRGRWTPRTRSSARRRTAISVGSARRGPRCSPAKGARGRAAGWRRIPPLFSWCSSPDWGQDLLPRHAPGHAPR